MIKPLLAPFPDLPDILLAESPKYTAADAGQAAADPAGPTPAKKQVKYNG